MWPFDKKREEPDKPNVVIQGPFTAYVRRIGPKDCHGVRTIGRIDTYEHVGSLDELEELVVVDWKGGTYRAKLHDDKDKAQYLGYHTWDVPGEPWVDGKEIQGDGKASSKDPVKQLQKKAEIMAAEKIVAQHQADLHKTRVELGLEEGDEGDEDDDDDSDEIGSLREELSELKVQMQQERLEDERRRREEEKERQWREEMRVQREEMKEQREKSDKRFETLVAKMEEQKQGTGMQSMFQLTLDSMKANAASSKETLQQMVTMLTAQLEQSKGSDNNSVENALGILTKTLEVTSQFGDSGEKSWLNEVLRKVLPEIASGLNKAVSTVAQANKPTPEAKQLEAGRITALAKQGAQALIEQTKQQGQVRIQEVPHPAANPTSTVSATEEDEEPEGQAETKKTMDEIERQERKEIIGEFVEILGVELRGQPKAASWPSFAYEHLSKDVLALLVSIKSADDISGLADVLRKDADASIVDEIVHTIKTDASAAKWLWQGIEALQQAVNETDVDTTAAATE